MRNAPIHYATSIDNDGSTPSSVDGFMHANSSPLSLTAASPTTRPSPRAFSLAKQERTASSISQLSMLSASSIVSGISPTAAGKSPVGRYGQMIRHLRVIQKAIDGLCQADWALGNGPSKRGDVIDNTDMAETDFPGVFTYVAEDIVRAFTEIMILSGVEGQRIPKGHGITAIQQVIIDFEAFCRAPQETAREPSNASVQRPKDPHCVDKARNYLRAILAAANNLIADHAQREGLTRWMVGPAAGHVVSAPSSPADNWDWKVECVGLSSLRYWTEQQSVIKGEKRQTSKVLQDIVEAGLILSTGSAPGNSNSDSMASKTSNELLQAFPEVLRHVHPSYVRHSIYARHQRRPFRSTDYLAVVHDSKGAAPSTTHMDRLDMNTLAYRLLFARRAHRVFMGRVEPLGEVVLSVRMLRQRELDDATSMEGGITISVPASPTSSAGPQRTSTPEEFETTNAVIFVCLLRCALYPNRVFHLRIPESDLRVSKRLFGHQRQQSTSAHPHDDISDVRSRQWRALMACIHPALNYDKLKKVHVDEAGEERHIDAVETPRGQGDAAATIARKLERNLMQLDELRTPFNFKFGMVLVLDGQATETEWFGNREATPGFRAFYETLGNVIPLCGHQGVCEGLCVRMKYYLYDYLPVFLSSLLVWTQRRTPPASSRSLSACITTHSTRSRSV